MSLKSPFLRSSLYSLKVIFCSETKLSELLRADLLAFPLFDLDVVVRISRDDVEVKVRDKLSCSRAVI